MTVLQFVIQAAALFRDVRARVRRCARASARVCVYVCVYVRARTSDALKGPGPRGR